MIPLPTALFALLHLGCGVAADDRHRLKLARVLYWGYPEIPVRDVVTALAFADQRSLVAAAGPVDTGVGCRRCPRLLMAQNRSRLAEIRKEVTGRAHPWRAALVCEACRDAEARREALAEPDSWPDDDEGGWRWDDDGYIPAA